MEATKNLVQKNGETVLLIYIGSYSYRLQIVLFHLYSGARQKYLKHNPSSI